MRLSDDFHNDNNNSFKMACAAVAAVSFVMLVILVTVYLNENGSGRRGKVEEKVHADEAVSANRITSSDLDFWKDYPSELQMPEEQTEEKELSRAELIAKELERMDRLREQSASENAVSGNGVSENSVSDNSVSNNGVSDNSVSKNSVSENGVSANMVSVNGVSGNSVSLNEAGDGRHTRVELSDGTEEWVLIQDNIPKNKYRTENFVYNSPVMKYFDNGRNISKFGIDVSRYNGVIDWEKVGKAGVSYAMIRYGVRGYDSGQIKLDDKFTANIEGAVREGIQVGVYFYSQAVTPAEAMEEANYVVAGISKYKISYPVVFDTEQISNDTARTDNLSRAQLTEIARTFCDTVKAWGYTPMIYGDKEQLVKRLDLSLLSEYDIWLAQPGTQPDYPYAFSMWQYAQDGKIDGINGAVSLNVTMVNYEEK